MILRPWCSRTSGAAGWEESDMTLHGAWCCSSCHDAIDGRQKSEHTFDELRLMHLEGVIRTQEALIDEGFIK
jgi:hypothetical protein